MRSLYKIFLPTKSLGKTLAKIFLRSPQKIMRNLKVRCSNLYERSLGKIAAFCNRSLEKIVIRGPGGPGKMPVQDVCKNSIGKISVRGVRQDVKRSLCNFSVQDIEITSTVQAL